MKNDYKVKIDDVKHIIDDPQPTGRQLLDKAVKRPVEEFVIFVFLDNGLMEEISLDETIDLRKRGIEKFITFKTDRLFRFELDGRTFEWGADLITGLTLKGLAQVNVENHDLFLESRDEGKNERIGDCESIDLSEEGLERFFTKKSNKMVTIIVEGAPYEWPRNQSISYGEVVSFEYPDYEQNPDVTYSVMYEKGRGNKPEGILSAGASVKVKEGMIFNVSTTGRS
jgi:hypothetical protein